MGKIYIKRKTKPILKSSDNLKNFDPSLNICCCEYSDFFNKPETVVKASIDLEAVKFTKETISHQAIFIDILTI